MTNDVVCSHEVHRKSKLMFELYVLHLPNTCRHRQIKQSAFGLASSLNMLPLALCLYLPDPKGRDLRYLWKSILLTGKGEALGLEEYPTPNSDFSLGPAASVDVLCCWALPSYLKPSKSRGYYAPMRNSSPIYWASKWDLQSLQERWNSCFSFKSLLGLADWTVFFLNISACNIVWVHDPGISSNQNTQCLKSFTLGLITITFLR